MAHIIYNDVWDMIEKASGNVSGEKESSVMTFPNHKLSANFEIFNDGFVSIKWSGMNVVASSLNGNNVTYLLNRVVLSNAVSPTRNYSYTTGLLDSNDLILWTTNNNSVNRAVLVLKGNDYYNMLNIDVMDDGNDDHIKVY
jgi:hypothetical protein